ncbi:MAG: hypothetical protein DWC11_04285 [Candidatus Poseidoniales archaeon]|nr:MAG: hypothetical protein DWC11_04285 [Candidatus Poseidoniales archaeon]
MVLRGGVLRPSSEQSLLLQALQDEVFEGIRSMGAWQGADFAVLRSIPLGVLRQGTVRRHGVTRWVRGVRLDHLRPEDVRVIDLHPNLLVPEWWDYAGFVLHHELIHATGHRRHDATFRRWEALWPAPSEDRGAASFAKMLHLSAARWWWTCPSCDIKHPRQRRGNGRYLCRRCGVALQDTPATEVVG